MIEEDLHLIQSFMHQAGTRAVADLIRSQSGEVEVYPPSARAEVQSSPYIQHTYPAPLAQQQSLPTWVMVTVVLLWTAAIIGVLILIMTSVVTVTGHAITNHPGAVLGALVLLTLAALVARRLKSSSACSGLHCGGCDQ